MNKPVDFGIADHWNNDQSVSSSDRKVYEKGKAGQIIVLACVGGLEEDNPFFNYPQPSFFVIKSVVDEGKGAYLLQDEQGNEVLLTPDMNGYFYFARHYAEYIAEEHDRQVDYLNGQLHDMNIRYETACEIARGRK